MPKWMTVAFALFLSLQVFSTQAHNVDDVIGNYIEAMGGKGKLHFIDSIYKNAAALTDSRASSRLYKIKDKLLRADFTEPLVDYQLKGHKAILLGVEDIDGKECYRIKLTLKSGQEIQYFIDAKSWYIVREIRTSNDNGNLKLDYADYKKTKDGFVFANSVMYTASGPFISHDTLK